VIVGDFLRKLGGEEETFGRILAPFLHHRGKGSPVEGGIDFNAVEDLGVEAEILGAGEIFRIEIPVPVLVRPTATADLEFFVIFGGQILRSTMIALKALR